MTALVDFFGECQAQANNIVQRAKAIISVLQEASQQDLEEGPTPSKLLSLFV